MAKPKLCLIPATQGTKLYSVLPADGVGDFTFSRGSSATRINSQGLIETVASGVSRLNYPLIDGVVNGCPSHLLEPIRSNLVPYSQDFSNSSWAKAASTITSNIITSPDGTLNASLFQSNVTDGYMYPPSSILSSAANGTFTYSIYAKEGNTSSFTILMTGGANYVGNFNLTTVVATTSSANTTVDISNVGNGWYRCSLIASLVPSSAYSELQIGRISSGSNLYLFGAQLEQGSYATSYIPTSGSAVTRAAETATGAGDAATFNDSEGVLMAEISALADGGVYRVISIEPATGTANRIIIYYDILEGKIVGRVDSAGTPVFNYTATVQNQTNFNKIALKYKQNDFALWINGIELGVGNTGNAPSGLNKLSFDNGVPADFFYGNTKQIQYFDSALNDSDLEKLTSWTSFTDLANGQLYSIK